MSTSLQCCFRLCDGQGGLGRPGAQGLERRSGGDARLVSTCVEGLPTSRPKPHKLEFPRPSQPSSLALECRGWWEARVDTPLTASVA
jgi:hypothetical protein